MNCPKCSMPYFIVYAGYGQCNWQPCGWEGWLSRKQLWRHRLGKAGYNLVIWVIPGILTIPFWIGSTILGVLEWLRNDV